MSDELLPEVLLRGYVSTFVERGFCGYGDDGSVVVSSSVGGNLDISLKRCDDECSVFVTLSVRSKREEVIRYSVSLAFEKSLGQKYMSHEDVFRLDHPGATPECLYGEVVEHVRKVLREEIASTERKVKTLRGVLERV